MAHQTPIKQLIALGALSLTASFTPFASLALDSRSTDYTIDKHLSSGGEICGTTEENGHIFKPGSAIDRQLLAQRQAAMLSGKAGTTDADTGKYIIPVVVHVFGSAHNCDANDGVCVTDDLVTDAIERTNQDFQSLNTLDAPILPEFAAIRDKLNIEFVLAKTDPQGNPTNGIVRHGEEAGQVLALGEEVADLELQVALQRRDLEATGKALNRVRGN
ncbi:MAG: hypothetical protein MJK04_29270, partial [Psychrosphaera sp.]|nr:hypothetical protein [Psychrosphaera sp.]